MKYWQQLTIGALLIGSSACAGMIAEQARSATSGYIGCPREEIVITDAQMHMGGTTWMASCRGARMTCSRESTGKDGLDGITHCAPEMPKPAP